jgi:hypothetical protein
MRQDQNITNSKFDKSNLLSILTPFPKLETVVKTNGRQSRDLWYAAYWANANN